MGCVRDCDYADAPREPRRASRSQHLHQKSRSERTTSIAACCGQIARKSGFGVGTCDVWVPPGACRKLNPAILVMQSAQDWATKNVPGAIDGARDRRIFLQG